jgi:hypothetical protein
MARKTDVRSSQKWSDSVSSSTASLPQIGFGLASPQHYSALNALKAVPMTSNRPGLNSWEVSCPSPTSSTNLGSKTTQ